jgi:O-antigen/teichoic acid export membrane protein
MSKKKTSQRVKQSMLSTLLGRSLSAFGGLFLLILLSRRLSPNEYGLFFTIWAMAEIAILVSNFGLIHTVYRYVSADEHHNGKIQAFGPIWKLVGLRCLSLLPVSLGLLIFPKIAGTLGAQILTEETVYYLAIIIFCEGISRFYEAIFDSMMCQGRSQFTLVIRTVVRLGGYCYFLYSGDFHIQQVLWVEVAAGVSGALLGSLMLLHALLIAHPDGSADRRLHELLPSYKSIFIFVFPAYLAQVLTLTYGPDALKLILSSTAGATAMAMFGFAYSLAGVIQRYMPINLLAGVFRPVFVAAAKKEDGESMLSILLGMCVKINWMMILPILCFFCGGGGALLSLISGGNYSDAGSIVIIILAALLLMAIHLTFSMYCLAQAVSWPILLATGASSIGFPIAFVLARNYGAVGISIVFLLSETLWCTVCYAALYWNSKGKLKLDWFGFLRILGIAVVAIIAGECLKLLGLAWYIAAPTECFLFIVMILVFMPFAKQEKIWILSILPVSRFIRSKAAHEA